MATIQNLTDHHYANPIMVAAAIGGGVTQGSSFLKKGVWRFCCTGVDVLKISYKVCTYTHYVYKRRDT